MVAVGFSPRTQRWSNASRSDAWNSRRTEMFNRRYATNVCLAVDRGLKAHGYHQSSLREQTIVPRTGDTRTRLNVVNKFPATLIGHCRRSTGFRFCSVAGTEPSDKNQPTKGSFNENTINENESPCRSVRCRRSRRDNFGRGRDGAGDVEHARGWLVAQQRKRLHRAVELQLSVGRHAQRQRADVFG